MILFFKDDKKTMRQLACETFKESLYYIQNPKEITKDSGIKISTTVLGCIIGGKNINQGKEVA